MTNLELIASVSLIHMGAVMSPGPDFIIVVKNALSYSRKTGVYTALGIGCGIIIHVLYTFFGIGLLIKESPNLFNIFKYIGGIYIIYIGVQSLISNSAQKKIIQEKHKGAISELKAFQIGFITNVFNVKAMLFFLGLFSTAIASNTSKETLYFLGVMIVIQTTLWFVLVAYFFSRPKIQAKYFKYESVFNKFFGLLLIILAVKILFF